MEKIGSRAFWILGVMTLMLTFGKVFGVSMCGDGDTYGYKPSQKSNITKQNNNSHYLSGTVWHSQKYGRFSCCGVIKAIEVIISKTGDIEFQVWSITVPVSKTATFLGYYRTHVDIEDGVIQNVTIPFDKQMPIRDGNAIGWVADESDIIKWAVNEDLINETDSDYLFEDFSEWSKPFASHPPSFSTLLNQHSFMNKGIKKRVFGVRPVVHPGYIAKIDNLPLSVPLYTTINKVNEVVYTFSVSGIPALEEAIYITVDVQINPSDDFLAWNNTAKQVTIERDLTKAVLEKPYEVTFTVSDGCHSDQTATLYVYVFDDDRDNQLSGCKSKEQRAYPPSAMWNQDQTEKYPEMVIVADSRWKYKTDSLLEAIEVCVSEPGSIDVHVWKEESRTKRKYKLLWRYTINVTEVGCPAPKIAIPPEKQFFGRGKDFTFGWGSTSKNTSILKFREIEQLPATMQYIHLNLSKTDQTYDTIEQLYTFEVRNVKQRDYGIRFYLGPGALPNITGLPTSVEIDVDDYKKYEVVLRFEFSDENTFQDFSLSFSISPPTDAFDVDECDQGIGNIMVMKDTLHGLEGTTYELVVSVSDYCVTTNQTITIYVVSSTTSTVNVTTTTKPTNTTTSTTAATTTTTTTISPELYTRSTAAICSCVSLAVVVAVGFMVALCHTFT